MKQYLIIFSLLTFVLYGCKKDEGLNDSDHKDKFIKALGTNAQGVDLKQTDDGGYILVGTTQGGASQDIYVKKVDAFGNSQWSKTYEGPFTGKNESVAGIQIMENGSYAIAGTTTIIDSAEIDTSGTKIPVDVNTTLLMILDPSGNKIHSRTYYSGINFPLAAKQDEECTGIDLSASGELLLVSQKNVLNENNVQLKASYSRLINVDNYGLIRRDSADLSISGGGNNIGFNKGIYSTSNRMVMTGFIDVTDNNLNGNTGGNGILLSVLIDESSSEGITKNLPYGDINDDEGNDLIENTNNEIIIAGYTTNGSKNYYVINFLDIEDEAPKAKWVFSQNKAGNQEVKKIIEVDNGYVLAGYSEINNDRQFYIMKIDKNGSSVLWEREYGYVGFDEANAVVETNDGGLAVLGTSSDERGNLVMTLLKLDSSGNLR